MKCERCKQREGILDFSQDMMSYTHGFKEKICRQCYIKILEGIKKNVERSLKREKDLLNKKGSGNK